MLAQVSNQGNVGNQNGNVVNENVQENIGNVIIDKMESVHDMSGCSIDQKVKYPAGSFVGKALTWWNSQIRTLSREVAISMSWNDFKFLMIQEFVLVMKYKSWKLSCGTTPWSGLAMLRILIGFMSWLGEPSKDKNGRDDNKRTRNGNAFATTVNPIGRENMGTWPKCTTCWKLWTSIT
ncbi:hypothetical protein Tco_0209380 [Tanacetum coccineum]